MKVLGILALGVYISSIVAANVALSLYGIIPVGLGFMAPAGSLFAGLCFIFRDIVQETLGKKYSIIAVFIGAFISAILSSIDLAIASGSAFLLSELLDLSVYVYLRDKSFILAAVISNIVGLLIDTFVFLILASIPLIYASGQIYAKTLSTIVFVIIYIIVLVYRKNVYGSHTNNRQQNI